MGDEMTLLVGVINYKYDKASKGKDWEYSEKQV